MTRTEAAKHLKNAILKIESYNSIGSGFFIAQGLVVTCHHVVNGLSASELELVWQGKTYKATSIESNPNSDLALVSLKIEEKHPYVQVDQTIELDNKCYSFGYSTKNGDAITFRYEGTDGDGLLKFKDGLFQSGLSGSPILNLQTLKACGVVKRTRDNELPIGGRGISISKLLEFKSLEIDDNGSIFSKEMFKTWVWKSSIESADRLQFSVLALFETLLAISGSFYLWVYYGFYWHIITGLIISPLFFLRNKKSERDAIALFLKKIKIEKTNSSHYIMFIAFNIIIYLRYELNINIILLLICSISFSIFIHFFNKNEYDKIILSRIHFLTIIFIATDYIFNINMLELMHIKYRDSFEEVFIPIGIIFYLLMLRLSIYAFFVKIYITIRNLSFSSLYYIPKNWFKLTLSIDIFHIPEIIPGIEKSNISHKVMTYSFVKISFIFNKKRIYSKYEKLKKFKKCDVDYFKHKNNFFIFFKKTLNVIHCFFTVSLVNLFVFFGNLFTIISNFFITIFDIFGEIFFFSINFIFSFFFRYSLKSTAWMYLPLIWLIQPQNKYDLTTRMKLESKNFIAYLMFFYSIIVVFIFTLLPLLFPHTKLGIYFQTISLPDTLKTIFFAYEFNFWHLSRLLSALITIIFMFSFTNILIKRETQPNYGDFWAAKLLSFRNVRSVSTLITLGFTAYLILGLLPENFFWSLWENMKFLPK